MLAYVRVDYWSPPVLICMYFGLQLVASSDETLQKVFGRSWANVYDNTLSTEQVRILAAQHNYQNVGSRPTAWIDRVRTCREWLFGMTGRDSKVDEVPEGSTEWKKSCQRMYVPPGTVCIIDVMLYNMG